MRTEPALDCSRLSAMTTEWAVVRLVNVMIIPERKKKGRERERTNVKVGTTDHFQDICDLNANSI